jgi:phenylacetate-CoA ligase
MSSSRLNDLRLRANEIPFYARKFAGLEGLPFEKLPFTTKSELAADQLAHPPYGSTLAYERTRYTRLHQTSGTSSGKPLRWLDTPESWQWLLSCWKTIYSHLDLTHEDVLFFPFSFGPFLGFWTAFEAACDRGHFCLSGGGLSSTARLQFLIEHRATVLCCTPTYALHLAELAKSEGIDLAASPVRMLIVAGEPGGSIAATRQRIETLWGARVIDHYGLTEVGPATIEPVSQPGELIVLESHFHAEVIDPETANPLFVTAEGVTGELVLTNLGRWGSPLIRYRTGDSVHAKRGADGRLTLVGGVLGRTDDMIHVRGNNLYPGSIEAVVRQFPEVAEFRLVVDKRSPMTDLCVEIEVVPNVTPMAIAEAVARALRDVLLFRIDVVPVGQLPRYEMKARRVVVRTS